MTLMKQCYHTIIKPESNGWFIGWVEEIPGTITHGRSLNECRENLRDSLQLMLETHRDEASLGLAAGGRRRRARDRDHALNSRILRHGKRALKRAGLLAKLIEPGELLHAVLPQLFIVALKLVIG